MKRLLLQIAPKACLFVFMGCQDLGVVPYEVSPGRRDYIWTVDTLRIPQGDYFYPTRIWGSASNDVWVACTGSPSTNLLWHFDGSRWTKDSLARLIDPSALWGFASNEIWLGNAGNSFWRYDGIQWYKFSEHSIPAFDGIAIEDIWGKSSSDVWGVGFAAQYSGSDLRAVVMHFNGARWQFVPIPNIRGRFVGIRGPRFSDELFIDSWREGQREDTNKVYLLERSGTLRQIYAGEIELSVEQAAGQVYFVGDQKVYKYINHKITLWRDFSNTEYLGWFKGRSELDFFGVSRDGSLMHYNGSDFQVVFPNRMQVVNMFVVGNSIFAPCVDFQNNVNAIIHGVLK